MQKNKAPEMVYIELPRSSFGSVTISTTQAFTALMEKALHVPMGSEIIDLVWTPNGVFSIGIKKGTPVARFVCDALIIKGVAVDNSGSCFATLDVRGMTCSLRFEDLLPLKLQQTLFGKGLVVTEDSRLVSALSKCLQEILSSFEPYDLNSPIGWKQAQGKLQWYGCNSDPPQLQYHLSLPSADEYFQQLNDLISGCTALQFVLCAAAASTVLAFLHITAKLPIESFGISLVGTSSTGKSSALQLAASLFSSPKDDNIYTGFYGTSNALVHILGRHQGAVMCYDETTINNSIDTRSFIYAFSEGMSKRKMIQPQQAAPTSTWLCTALFTAETHLIDPDEALKRGLHARMINLDDWTYTRNADHANAIKTFAATNYGLVANLLAEQLLQTEPATCQAEYETCKQALVENEVIKCCDLTERIIGNYAVITYTAVLLIRLGIQVDIGGIVEKSIALHNQVSDNANPGRTILCALFNYITAHYNQVKGVRWVTKDDGTPVRASIVETTFQEILHACGIDDVGRAVKLLDAEGYLLRQSNNRLKSKLRIDGVSCYGYQFAMKTVDAAFGDNVSDKFSNTGRYLPYLQKKEEKLDIQNNEEAIIHDGNYRVEGAKTATVGKAFLL